MLRWDEADKFSFENRFVLASNRHRDDFLFAFFTDQGCGSDEAVSLDCGFQEFRRSGTEDDVGMVDCKHGRVIGEAKHEPTVNQAALIGDHEDGEFRTTSSFEQMTSPLRTASASIFGWIGASSPITTGG